jgi:hypothetical protein
MGLCNTISIRGALKSSDQDKLKEVELKLKMVRNTYENILPIHSAIDRKKRLLELDIKILEDEKFDLINGQLNFDEDMGF